jgi:predicted dehydrogenase
MSMERIRTVLVGLNFGQWMLEHELHSGVGKETVELTGVCDLDHDKAAQVAAIEGVRHYARYEDVLADPQVEAVLLITGPVGRAAMVEAALDAGKHVMTTKPFDLSADETLRVLRKAAVLGRVVHMNSPTPMLTEDLKRILSWRDTHDLGRPVSFRASTYCSYREKADGSWYDDPLRCPVAPVFRLGIYLLNDLVRLVSPVRTVQVLQSRLFTGRPTPDNAQLGLLCEDGEIGSVSSSFCIDDRQPYRCTLEINYERGTVYRNQGPRLQDERDVLLELSASGTAGQILDSVRVPDTGGYQWEVFRRMVRGELLRQDLTPEQAASAVRVIERMSEQAILP